jgi:hypothetical protein
MRTRKGRPPSANLEFEVSFGKGHVCSGAILLLVDDIDHVVIFLPFFGGRVVSTDCGMSSCRGLRFDNLFDFVGLGNHGLLSSRRSAAASSWGNSCSALCHGCEDWTLNFSSQSGKVCLGGNRMSGQLEHSMGCSTVKLIHRSPDS